jgi:perosamine synthetase
MIPVFKPNYGEEEWMALRSVFESGWIGLGPKTEEFERRFAEYIGVKYAIALNSCTAALHLALFLCEIKGAEVITTPMTFISTNHAILYNGGVPVFCDIEEDTLCIDATKIESLITQKTKAIVIVHYGGQACDMDEILKICNKYNLKLIEDCAHACGGSYKGKKLGSFGDFGCFSFHAVKNLATGDGGMITTNNPESDKRLRSLRWLGITKDTWSRQDAEGNGYSWYYSVEEVGFKYHMNDIASAIGLVQLSKLEASNARRRQICLRYLKAFSDIKWIKVPSYRTGIEESSCHNFVIRTPFRDLLNEELTKRGISTGVHYIPNNHYPLYKKYHGKTPVSDLVWKEILTLPVYPELTDEEVDFIIKSVIEVGEGKK